LYDGEHFLESRHIAMQVGHCAADGTIAVETPALGHVGGVIIGPSAFPFEIERTAECVDQRLIGRDQSLLVCPATTDAFQLAQRRGWAQTIRNAGGSVLDVGLVRRLGAGGLVALASGGEGRPVIVTSPLPDHAASGRPAIILAGARTAIQYGLGLA
ncbi:MAG TPA: hypothetical protein VM118_06220, partial [Acidobacteriota bacterium]|nr:hypothetical protein [Acidobacteriota bacterium]